MKNIIKLIVLLVFVSSCEPPEEGYISDKIHALEDTIFVSRGNFIKSAAPASEGSTYPLSWEITGVTDADGNITDDLFKKYEIVTWKAAYDPNTDKTLELAKEKIVISKQPSLLINNISGELAFTQATKFAPKKEIYKINVKASNVKGSVQLDDFVVVKMEEFKPVEFPTEMRSRLNLVKKDGKLKALYTSKIKNNFDDNVPSVLDGTHSHITITKTDDNPSVGIKVKMTITDSYDKPLDPKKVLFYPKGTSYYQNYHDNSTETTTDATSTYFSLPAPPFPQFARNYTGSSSYLMYYITSRDAFNVDKAAYEADNGSQDWSGYQVDASGSILCQAYIRWGIKINDSGTWHIKMRIPYSKLK